MNITCLPMQDSSNETLLRVSEIGRNEYKIEVGPWYGDGTVWPEGSNYLTSEPVLLNKRGVKSLVREILNNISKRTSVPVNLDVSWLANSPKMTISMCYMTDRHPLHSKNNIGKFQFRPSVKIKYLVRACGRDEDKYLLENDMSSGLFQYYPAEILTKFCHDLLLMIGGDLSLINNVK